MQPWVWWLGAVLAVALTQVLAEEALALAMASVLALRLTLEVILRMYGRYFFARV